MKILLFADIHIGSIKEADYVYHVFTEIIDKEMIFSKTDLVVILGDYFDKLFKVNEEFVSLAINMMSYLVRACQREKTKLRIIYGTESHEMNQYRLFNYHITSDSIDMKIFDTVTEESIDGLKILYVPEEYIDDKKKHYSKYLTGDNHYDYIFGHGIIEDGMPDIVTYTHEENKNNEKHVPRFKSGELARVSDLCIFGHYHCFTDMGNNVYYLGSLFRDSFGEESPKGYGVIEDGKFRFVENTKAYIYKTYRFDEDSEILETSDGIIRVMNRLKEENPDLFSGKTGGKIRLIVDIPENIDSSFIENIRSIVSNDKRFFLQIVNIVNGKSKDEDKNEDEDEDDVDDELSFVIDDSLGIVSKIHRWMCRKYEDPMTMDDLNVYLEDTLEKIKNKMPEDYEE